MAKEQLNHGTMILESSWKKENGQKRIKGRVIAKRQKLDQVSITSLDADDPLDGSDFHSHKDESWLNFRLLKRCEQQSKLKKEKNLYEEHPPRKSMAKLFCAEWQDRCEEMKAME
ncbi:hypothetical protein X777_05008 [Ooceraea biroi]|uniref:Uncharacterized protein n=1 Tax=Ooceraea biroi TaxID=2015173 RepID=A0A026WFL7_OOCBI|nr:hypothetical protein X777_05008 [Ooceraea biroi]